MKDKKRIVFAYIVTGLIGSYALWFYPLVNYLGADPLNELKMFRKWPYADLWCWIHFFTSILIVVFLIGKKISKKDIYFFILLRLFSGVVLLIILSEKLSVAIFFWVVSFFIDVKLMRAVLKREKVKDFLRSLRTFSIIVIGFYLFFYACSSKLEHDVKDCYPIIKRKMKTYQSNYYSIPDSYLKNFYEIRGTSDFEDYYLSRAQYLVLAREECSVGANFFTWYLFWPRKMKKLYSEKELLTFLLENMRFNNDGEYVVGISKASCKFLNKSFPEITLKEFRFLISKSQNLSFSQDEDVIYEVPSKECNDICELE